MDAPVTPDFDDATYLRMNPDVAAAIQMGTFQSGWQHAVLYGYREGRPGLSLTAVDRIRRYRALDEIDPSLPLPPENLRTRIHGSDDSESFRSIGSQISKDILNALANNHITLPTGPRVLDFGCGCGRVLVYLKRVCVDWNMYGTDIDSEAIEWCNAYLHASATFGCNETMPPLCCNENEFDLVYSVSVFTHLPEDMQFAWLSELQRVVKIGGHLLLTIHSDDILPYSYRENSKEEGFYYINHGGTEGLPDFYQSTFHSREYLESNWGKYFNLLDIAHKGIANYQDLVLCRKQ